MDRNERLFGHRFEPMVNVIPEGRHGDVEIDHFVMTPEESRFTALRAMLNRRSDEFCPPGRYARLTIRGSIMMTDTEMERRSNIEVITHASGDVLVAGLGLGMIVLPILRNPTVRSLTVIEKSADVIALVEPPIRKHSRSAKKLSVICADIFDWRPDYRGRQFDTIYFDIWPAISEDNLDDMRSLRRRFAHYLRVGGWSGCWKMDDLRERSRSWRRS